jgi:hypothetical protein
MRRMVARAELATDHRGDALGGPHVAQEAKGSGAIRQQGGQLGSAARRSDGGRARGNVDPERVGASFAHLLQPLADVSGVHIQSPRNSRAGPPITMGVPGPPTAPFVHRVARGSCSYCHTSRCTRSILPCSI